MQHRAVPQPVHVVDRRRIDVANATLHAQSHGAPDAPAVVLMGSLASDVTSWEPQVPALLEAGFRVVAFDYRGHGSSSVSPPPFTLKLFQNDLRAVVRSFALSRPHLVGLSLGGMVALGEALDAGADYGKMVIASARADMPPPLADAWEERQREVRGHGVAAIVDGTLERWFTAPFRRERPELFARVRRMILQTDPAAYADCIDIVRRVDLLERLGAIHQPMLYVTGALDTASPAQLMRDMSERTPGARFATVANAAHLPNLEQPEAFNRLIVEFLTA